MRGPGQIAELTAIAEPDVGVIVNVGPAHLELLGSLEAIAAAKAELIAGPARRARRVVVPAGEPLLAPHLRADLRDDHLRRGRRGDAARAPRGRLGADRARRARRSSCGRRSRRRTTCATCSPRWRRRGRSGTRRAGAWTCASRRCAASASTLPGGVVLIDDCYNANPMSMRAAIDDLAETAPARRVAVLGDMLELGPEAPRLHREIGAHAARARRGAAGGGRPAGGGDAPARSRARSTRCRTRAAAARAARRGCCASGDTVLVKGSRGVGLERVERCGAARRPASARRRRAPAGASPPGQR